jgi:hypothetical protein
LRFGCGRVSPLVRLAMVQPALCRVPLSRQARHCAAALCRPPTSDVCGSLRPDRCAAGVPLPRRSIFRLQLVRGKANQC